MSVIDTLLMNDGIGTLALAIVGLIVAAVMKIESVRKGES